MSQLLRTKSIDQLVDESHEEGKRLKRTLGPWSLIAFGIATHRGRCGAVAGMKRIRNAAKIARLVMERTPHVLLVGESATRFAFRCSGP